MTDEEPGISSRPYSLTCPRFNVHYFVGFKENDKSLNTKNDFVWRSVYTGDYRVITIKESRYI